MLKDSCSCRVPPFYNQSHNTVIASWYNIHPLRFSPHSNLAQGYSDHYDKPLCILPQRHQKILRYALLVAKVVFAFGLDRFLNEGL